jgi:hypothetical protein
MPLQTSVRRVACVMNCALGVFALACSSARLYYVYSELPTVGDDVAVGPGPWPEVPAVVSDEINAPDALVLPMLKALMGLPGAVDACDAYGKPRPDAAEYCVGVYKTPEDWRVTWPIRKLTEAHSSCKPPFGGVDDVDFGRGLPIFGFAHNHTCGLFASSRDLTNFPARRVSETSWVTVSYATTPEGDPARDARGDLIPAWAWLATGHASDPRFYKWSPAGEVYRWSDARKRWELQARCEPQSSSVFYTGKALAPKCTPDITEWY